MFQEIAIILIGIGVAAYIGWKVYKLFTTPRVPGSPCSGCKGCALKDEINLRRKPDNCPLPTPDGRPKRKRPETKKQPTCFCS